MPRLAIPLPCSADASGNRAGFCRIVDLAVPAGYSRYAIVECYRLVNVYYGTVRGGAMNSLSLSVFAIGSIPCRALNRSQ